MACAQTPNPSFSIPSSRHPAGPLPVACARPAVCPAGQQTTRTCLSALQPGAEDGAFQGAASPPCLPAHPSHDSESTLSRSRLVTAIAACCQPLIVAASQLAMTSTLLCLFIHRLPLFCLDSAHSAARKPRGLEGGQACTYLSSRGVESSRASDAKGVPMLGEQVLGVLWWA